MRRLPIYFLIDVSESMIGNPIEEVQEGIATIVKELKTDPYALETVSICIIGFAGKSEIITPLQEIISFYPPKIPIGSGTSLAQGLQVLMQSFDRDLIKTTYEQKGDWKPVVFLFTDGVPTDSANYTDETITSWNNQYRKQCSLVAISIGENTNYNLLGKLTDHVLQFNNTTSEAYHSFFNWVTASIKATSVNVNANIDRIDLSKAHPDVIEKIDLTKNHTIPDDQFVVLNAKCSKTERMYLIKFKRSFSDSGFWDLQSRDYIAEGAFRIDEATYKQYSSNRDYSLKVSSQELRGNPSCPCCGNIYSVATCVCGGVHCISGDGYNTCPWCGNEGHYGLSDSDFDINRTLG
ncbi:TerY-C metal binding domain-containing protein [Myroides odoratus]|uniref:VWA domain-containing protein n=1 Tax=Myroides odoratus TaxID=256 RepID=A0A9Q7EAL6_MYROD|nr:TerY-C metal binding domain-containing protein [Myroides odoratus]EHQ42783.1 von Willebrand factor type A [Myroides odoratus DSM 2801]EKB07360.1 hypothetical protein HMPREF9716_01810 [Myroides odoratus CIP 103059]QQU00139.1 VWA domain-containing protein [Myroides odoratus]WQD57640.1 TerY-C metal binding domain-containing protein [Myroides odoratus]STZ30047.1 Uncharacterized protein encoded in toxicity protection region of plasmid R478, contains von Willebrand factor (vWF) domain [Myroides o